MDGYGVDVVDFDWPDDDAACPLSWCDAALFAGAALAVGGLVWSGLRRLVKS